MSNPDFTLEFIKEQKKLLDLCEILSATPVFALDIETVEWWNRQRERVALIQIAFRTKGLIKVAVIDALAGFKLDPLRAPLELGSSIKVIHNAAFDAARLASHYEFDVSPVYDTMLAARRSGERKYSLKAQAMIHLDLALDKSARMSDWAHRPLTQRQLYYAALDPFATLLLYENQKGRNLKGEYLLKNAVDSSQGKLPLDDMSLVEQQQPHRQQRQEEGQPIDLPEEKRAGGHPEEELLPAAAAVVLGIVAELPSRYGPGQLCVSLGSERIGVAGWIADTRLGRDVELDEDTVKLIITDLCERRLLHITETGRLEASEEGAKIWQGLKSN